MTLLSIDQKIIEAAKAGAGPILERLEKLRSELIAVLDQEKQAVHELADKSFNEGSSDQELVDAERQIMAALKDHNLGEVTAALEALRKGLKDIVEREKQGVGSLEDVVVGAETKDAELLDLDSKIIEARKAEIAKVQGLLDGLRQGLVKIVTEEGSEGVSVSVEETDDKTLLSADGAIHAERREALAKMSERVSGLRSGIAGVVNKERGSDVLDVDSDADDKLIEEDAAVHQERREALEQIKQQLEGLRSGLLDVVNEEGEEDISGEVSDKEMIAADRKIHQARASLVNILTKQLDTLRSGLVDIINEERDEFDDLEEANVVMGDQKMLEADKTIIRTRREEIKKLRIELQDLRAGLLRICEHERVGFDDIEKLELNSDSDDQTLLSIDQKIIDAAKAGVQPVIDRLEALRRSLIQIIDEEKEAVHELANKEFGEGSKDEELVSAERKIIYALKDHNLEQITAELEALRRGLTEIVQREKEGIESMDGLNVDESTSDGTLLNLDAKIIDARKAESAAVRKELDELRDGLAKIVNEEGESDVTKDSGDDQLLKLDHTIHRNRAAELDQIKEDLLKLRKGLVVIVNAAGKDIENMEPVRVDSGDKAILAQDQKILDMRQSQIEELSMDLKRIRAGLLRICEHERVGFDDIEKLELNSDSDDQTLLSIDQKIIDAAKAGVQPVIDRLEALRRSLIQIIDEEKEAVHELANKEFGEGSKDEELVSAERKIIYALKDHNLEQITAELEALRRGLTEIVQREKEGIESMDGLNVDESTSDGTLLNLDAKIIDARKAESAAVRKELDELRDGLAKIVNEEGESDVTKDSGDFALLDADRMVIDRLKKATKELSDRYNQFRTEVGSIWNNHRGDLDEETNMLKVEGSTDELIVDTVDSLAVGFRKMFRVAEMERTELRSGFIDVLCRDYERVSGFDGLPVQECKGMTASKLNDELHDLISALLKALQRPAEPKIVENTKVIENTVVKESPNWLHLKEAMLDTAATCLRKFPVELEQELHFPKPKTADNEHVVNVVATIMEHFVRSYKDDMAKKSHEIAKLRKELVARRAQIENLHAEVETLKNDLHKAHKRLEASRSRIRELEAEIERLKKEIQRLKNRLAKQPKVERVEVIKQVGGREKASPRAKRVPKEKIY
eukprot:TRINITY_DN703_c1_g1_i7.p1 TRINITY_DN703_c1_g1~~TRINITY_DN703_c1_g1_i7.p1  ORF type:complete len:1250 (+),score=587.42 TRINITY_DN703_c1_g1_i7:311-3751(+)